MLIVSNCVFYSSESIRYLNYQQNYNIQFFIIMKKPNPNLNNKPASKPKPAAGFGFGDAMFTVKNLTSDYSSFDDPPTFQTKPQVAKNPFVNKNPVGFKSPVVPVKKPAVTQPNKVTVVQQKQESNLPKEVFKIQAGNQYKNNLKLIQLNQIQQSGSVIQLTANKVGSKWEYNVFCDGVPANKIVEKPEISFRFNGDQLKQGQLGNCYFIAALASIAHFPEVLRERIPEFKKYNCEEKSFRVTMFESGKLIEVIVDNLFPHVYVQPVGNDISPMIIEKAYAQTYGSFEVINVGFAIDALRDLTGAPTEELSLKDKPFLRNRVAECFKQQFGLVIASKVGNITPLLSAKHSYNVLNYQQINGQLFLQLRDPRGWTKAAFNTPKKLQSHPENGKFWIGEKDLEANFQMISIGKYIKGYTYFYKTFAEKDLTNRTGGLLMYPKTSMKVFVTIHQKHRKFFDDENYSYYVMRLLVAEVDGLKVVRTIKTNYKTQQVCTIELDLDPRPHLIIGQIGRIHPKDLYPQEIFTISVYAERRDISFQHVYGNIELKPYLISYMNENRQEFEQYQKNGLEKSYGQLFGYICVYYQNKGEKQVAEEIEYTVKNIEITEKKVQLLPKQNKFIMHPIYSEAYQCSMKANTLFK